MAEDPTVGMKAHVYSQDGNSIHRLHASFNVVSDVAVEQPSTRNLRTHLYCLQGEDGNVTGGTRFIFIHFRRSRSDPNPDVEGVGSPIKWSLTVHVSSQCPGLSATISAVELEAGNRLTVSVWWF
ncbi:hypothetical protein EYF80_034495 [Liparis tanakae]|uniref:Uncharacterized protein n=1 Tax=Liparis tanakae TaxID=230148 RepID=A0A4Z2GQC9_9TELE|nr:hypothetical protein EYF80_034495 [Liparis tanakae]